MIICDHDLFIYVWFYNTTNKYGVLDWFILAFNMKGINAYVSDIDFFLRCLSWLDWKYIWIDYDATFDDITLPM